MWTILPGLISDELFTIALDWLPYVVGLAIGGMFAFAFPGWDRDKKPTLIVIAFIGLLWLGYNRLDGYIMDLVYEESARAYNGGVCETLCEDVFTMVIFLDDDETSWTEKERKAFVETIDSGLQFVMEQGKQYGYELVLDFGYYDHDSNDIPDTTSYWGVIAQKVKADDPVNPDLLEQSAKALGFATVNEMVRYHQEYSGKKQIAYLLCVDKPSRSYAFAHNGDTVIGDRKLTQNLSYLYYDEVEYGVLYSKYDDKKATKAGTVAHEFLHLFGAMDYYSEDGERVQREKLAKKLCPKDVMLDDRKKPGSLKVGDFTAYTVGWLEEMPEQYERDEWWN